MDKSHHLSLIVFLNYAMRERLIVSIPMKGSLTYSWFPHCFDAFRLSNLWCWVGEEMMRAAKDDLSDANTIFYGPVWFH